MVQAERSAELARAMLRRSPLTLKDPAPATSALGDGCKINFLLLVRMCLEAHPYMLPPLPMRGGGGGEAS